MFFRESVARLRPATFSEKKKKTMTALIWLAKKQTMDGGPTNRHFIVKDFTEGEFGQWTTDEVTGEQGCVDDEGSYGETGVQCSGGALVQRCHDGRS